MTPQELNIIWEVGITIGAIIFFTILYFLPWIIAAKRKSRNRAWVAIINVFLGWTLLFWFVALALACGEFRD